MDVINLLSWIVLGFLAGYIANLIDPRAVRGGLVGTTLTGILGAVLGGLLSNAIFGIPVTGLNITSLIIATIGAFILVFIEREVLRRA